MECSSAKNWETTSLYEQSLCSDSEIPKLDVSLSSNTKEETTNPAETSRTTLEASEGSIANSSPISSAPPDLVTGDRLGACTLVDVLRTGFAVQRDRIIAAVESDSGLHNHTYESKPEIALSQERTERTRTCSPMRLHPDVDFSIEDSRGLKTEYTVYTCHHIDDTDFIMLPQCALEELERTITSRDDKLQASRMEIADLEKALRDTQKAENKAVSTIIVTRQEKQKARAENQLLQQALQSAQRGYSAAQGEAKTLQRTLEGTRRDRDSLQERLEAAHEVLAATKLEQMNLRKDHEFAKTQSKGYLRAMQQSIDGHEAARQQLKEHYERGSQIAAAKTAMLERRNAEVEERLAFVSERNTRGDEQFDASSTGSLSTMVDGLQEKKQAGKWGLGIWRVSSARIVDDLETGRLTLANPTLADGTDTQAQQIAQNSWGIKSLRLPGAWGGRTRDSMLPIWEP